MERIQKYPKTIGDFVDAKDYSNLDNSSSSANTTTLNTVLKHAVERVDVNKTTTSLNINASTLSKQIQVIGTDGNMYLVPAMLWQKPKKPTINCSDSIICTSKDDKLNVTITNNNSGGGTVYYTLNGDNPVAGGSTTRTGTSFSITPTFNEEIETVTIKAMVVYAGLSSDIISKTVSLKRKLKITLSYSPSNPGEGTAMYYSPSGTVIATSNQSLSTTDHRPLTWVNSKQEGNNDMTFYEDTQGGNNGNIWFEVSQNGTGANDGWLPADRVYGQNLLIRHLYPLSIAALSPDINTGDSGRYEPYKRLTITAGKNKNLQGQDITTYVSYKVVYNGNILNPNNNQASDTQSRFNSIDDFTSQSILIYGDCNVSGITSAVTENTPDGVKYWKGQTASENFVCRHLKAPNVTYQAVADSHTLTNTRTDSGEWASAVTFTMTKTNVKEADNTTVGGEIHYTTNSTNPTPSSSKYDTSVPISPSTTGENSITKESVRAIHTCDTWITSDVTKKPSSTVTFNRPHVYLGTYNKSALNGSNIDTFFNNSANQTAIRGILNNSNNAQLHILKTDNSGQPLLFETRKAKGEFSSTNDTNAITVNYDANSGTIFAYPKSWGRVSTILSGQIPYQSAFSSVEMQINSVAYYVYYANTLGSVGSNFIYDITLSAN